VEATRASHRGSAHWAVTWFRFACLPVALPTETGAGTGSPGDAPGWQGRRGRHFRAERLKIGRGVAQQLPNYSAQLSSRDTTPVNDQGVAGQLPRRLPHGKRPPISVRNPVVDPDLMCRQPCSMARIQCWMAEPGLEPGGGRLHRADIDVEWEVTDMSSHQATLDGTGSRSK
jgi:hypothetical protein